MSEPEAEFFDAVPGGADLRAWFDGYVPRFHDAEVLSIAFDRDGPTCVLKVHAFQMTSKVSPEGFYVLKNHVVVTFRIGEVTGMQLDDFNHQNALQGLRIASSQTDVQGAGMVDVFRVELDPAYGLGGFVEGQTLSITQAPGIPAGGQYQNRPNTL